MDNFWNATTTELKQGYTTNADTHTCLFCSAAYTQGTIYNIADTLYDATAAINTHIQTAHPSIFDICLGLGRVYTGLSAGQEEIARLMYAGHSDKDIVRETNANSISTILNQRFAIREKYKQAKILVTLVELMEEKMLQSKKERKATNDESFVNIHLGATNVDERFAITAKEKDEVLSRYFNQDGQLVIKNFPAKEKKKIIVMQKIMENFRPGQNYTEPQINEILKRYYEDFVTIRRYLVQYGFMSRDKSGAAYWVVVPATQSRR